MNASTIYSMRKVNPLVLLLFVVLLIVSVFFIAKLVFKLLYFVAPVLFIGALLINYKVVWGYGKWLVQSFKRSALFGVLAVLFTFIGSPFVALFLFLRALSSRGYGMSGIQQIGYSDYEVVDDEDFLDLTNVTEQKKRIDKDYGEMFK